MPNQRVLHVLSQRPSHTGSGTTLAAMVTRADAAGWEQHVVAAVPVDDCNPSIGSLPPNHLHPLVFGEGRLPFALPGMSDVMPYPSTRYSSLTSEQLVSYRTAWREHVSQVIAKTQPDLIHSHHVWLLSSMLKDIAPNTPTVTHCHATGLRQMELCPHLANEVIAGCRRNDRFVVLHEEQQRDLASKLEIAEDCVEIVGGGFRDEVFRVRGGQQTSTQPSLVYAGKLSNSKGLPWLLDAIAQLRDRLPNIVLHVAGAGAGEEADAIKTRMEELTPNVVFHGQLSPESLADLMRSCRVFVLPSFYEGLALVLVEAIACGCQVVCTALPGAVNHLAPVLGDAMELVPLPPMKSIDVPEDSGCSQFVSDLSASIVSAIAKPPNADIVEVVKPFTWPTVFQRVEQVWLELLRA